MTTTMTVEERCAVCGVTSQFTAIASSSVFGAPDLDGRPPRLIRATLPWWIRRCPSCGYCNVAVSDKLRGADRLVRSSAYRQQLTDPEYPELARSFLCCGLLHESAGDDGLAGGMAHRAAWVCDDHQHPKADDCRRLAVARLRRAGPTQGDREHPGGYEALLCDLLRRSGDFDDARDECERGLQRRGEGMIRRVLLYQRQLIARRDRGAHTLEDAATHVPDA